MSKLVPVFVDLETYWSKDHTLTKMNPITYCTHKETELLSIAYKFGDSPAECVVGEGNIKAWAKQVVWSNKFVIGHNLSLFDSMILRWRLGIKPKMWGCSLAMSRPLHGLTVGGSLAALVEHYGIGKKDQSAIVNTKGRHLCDFTDAEINALMEYNKADVEQCAELFKRLLPQTPKAELQVIDMTVRMLVEPKFRVDTELLSRVLCEERERKHLMLLDLATMLGTNVVGKTDEEVADDVAKTLGSSSKFAKLLHDLGVEPPMKPSPANPEKQTYALAKTDEAFIALTQHNDPMVAAAANARLGVKSTILETRIEAFLEVARCTGGRMPIAKNYYGAHTGRFSGAFGLNQENLPRVERDKDGTPTGTPMNALRLSLCAPKGHKVVVSDLSGIELRVNHFLWQAPRSMELFRKAPAKADLYKDFASKLYNVPVAEVTEAQRQIGKLCIAEGTLVLTDRGEIPIEEVTANDKVWDGVEWVSTLGAVYKGEKEVIEYDGLIATPDHEVWVADGRKVPFWYAATQSLRLARTGAAGVPLGYGGVEFVQDDVSKCSLRGQHVTDSAMQGAYIRGNIGQMEPKVLQAKRRVWDLLNCGHRHRFTANGRLVSNCHLGLGYSAGAKTFVRIAKLMGGVRLSLDEATEIVARWRTEYAEIVRGWKKCQQALSAISQGCEVDVDPWGLVRTDKEGFVLPTGRKIRYPELRQIVGDDGKPVWKYGTGRNERFLTGGKCDENIVQALARDVLIDAIMRIKKKTGLYPAHTVHDEVVYIVPESDAESILEVVNNELQTPPSWWPDLVVWSKGDVADRYGEAK